MLHTLQPAQDAHRPVSNVSVPFYMYELGEHQSERLAEECLLWFDNFKVFPDRALHLGLQDHPWRTRDPTKATLFYMPVELSAIMRQRPRQGDLRAAEDACRRSMTIRALALAEHVLSSQYFRRRNGADHFTTGHSWQVGKQAALELGARPLLTALQKMVVLTDDLETPRGIGGMRRVVTPYGVAYGAAPPPVAVPFAQRNHSLLWIGRAIPDKAYRARRRSMSLHRKFPTAVLICFDCHDLREWLKEGTEPYPSCSELPSLNGCQVGRPWVTGEMYRSLLQNSRFGLHFRGDTASSGRLYDVVAAGAIPIIVSDDDHPFELLAMPFKEDLPWNEFSFTISEQEFLKQPAAAIAAVVFAPPAVLEAKLAALVEARSSLLWVADGWQSRVPSLALRQVARMAGASVAPTDYRALPSVSMEKVRYSPARKGRLQQVFPNIDEEFWEEYSPAGSDRGGEVTAA